MYPKNPTLFKVSSYCHMRYHTTLSNFDELDVVFLKEIMIMMKKHNNEKKAKHMI